jgi:predicted transcriptional regulator
MSEKVTQKEIEQTQKAIAKLQELGMSKSEVAKMMNISLSYLSKIQKGNSQMNGKMILSLRKSLSFLDDEIVELIQSFR